MDREKPVKQLPTHLKSQHRSAQILFFVPTRKRSRHVCGCGWSTNATRKRWLCVEEIGVKLFELRGKNMHGYDSHRFWSMFITNWKIPHLPMAWLSIQNYPHLFEYQQKHVNVGASEKRSLHLELWTRNHPRETVLWTGWFHHVEMTPHESR